MATSEEKEEEYGNKKTEKEGTNLLGSPTFKELENGRLKCVETGHELPSKEIPSYSNSKKCRLGLINFALSNQKTPLNMFKQDPLSDSKLICKLTGDNINKSEEHIWKHMTGKRFLNKLEQEEEGKLPCHGMEGEESLEEPQSAGGGEKDKKNKKKKKKNKDKKKKNKDKRVEEIISEVRKSSNGDSDTEEEDFWMPPVGERWDHDDGEDRWRSDSESEEESKEDVIDDVADEDCKESEELLSRTKRMSIEIGPSSFASRKKKSKKNHQT